MYPDDPLRPPGVHVQGGQGAAASRRDRRAQPDALLRCVLGLGFPRGWRSQRAAGGRALRSAAVSASCIYEGTIRHRRFDPRREFSHRLALAYLDLDELPGLLDGRLITRRPGLVRFRRRDYLGDPAVALHRAVRDLVEDRTGARPEGPIRLLTQLRS